MNIYLEAEKRLAELLGWADIVESDVVPNVLRGTPSAEDSFTGIAEGTMKVPKYTRNDVEAFNLMVNHEQYPFQSDDGVIVVASGLSSPSYYTVIIDDHIDKATAVRYAIVMATIRKLEAMK